tara:strand:+ start:8693 stop:9574 length:882 start_codon:yes stop_codon:yes gene_type:complete
MPRTANPKPVIALALAGAILAAPALADTPATWSPTASEQLIKLPGDYLKKAVDNDFARSRLAAALVGLDRNIALKQQTLADLQAAIERADGELRTELQHQFLEEKRNYIDMMKEHQDLRARRANTKVRLYERLLSKLNRAQRAVTPQQADLLTKQNSARARFEASAARIDTRLLSSSVAAESKYAREYAKNLSAIESLVQAVKSHPMNQTPQIAGVPVSRGEYLRQLVAENQAEVAVVDQERAILGYMAKLVSLDALALSEGIDAPAETEIADAADNDRKTGVTGAVDFFVSR